MRLISYFIAFLLIPQMTFASTSDLKAIIDEYTYSMTVEWDQKDKEFAQQKLSELQASLQELDLEKFSTDDLKQVFPMIRVDVLKDKFDFLKGMKSSELESFLIQNQSNLYQQGSSWNSELTFPIVFVGFFVTLVAINIYRDNTKENCALSGGLLVSCSN